MNSLEVEKRAKELFDSGFYCAESVLQAVAEHAAIHSPLIPENIDWLLWRDITLQRDVVAQSLEVSWP